MTLFVESGSLDKCFILPSRNSVSLPDRSEQSGKATAQDLLAVIKGKATPVQKKLVGEALDDPFSQISELCRSIEQWAKERLHAASSNPEENTRSQRPSRAEQRLNRVMEFVRQKHNEGVLSKEQIAALVSPGFGGTDFAAPPMSSVECNSLAVRILKALEKAHPELAPQLDQFRTDRRR